jgi:metal-responsive CopG/Arc/MetJ family transcriptional regulator
MPTRPAFTEKITVSMPKDLVQYADRRATTLGISRSQVIGQAVAELRSQEQEQLAREGYLFYAAELEGFAAASLRAASEALDADGG